MTAPALLEELVALDDPDWEVARLGPGVDRARARLAAQRAGRPPCLDPTPRLLLALRRVPHYQALFARLGLGEHDLRRPEAWDLLPITRRADLAAGADRFCAHPVDPDTLERGWLGLTSGSTGEPVPYFRSPATLGWFYAFVDFAMAYAERPPIVAGPRAGVVLLDSLAIRPPYAVDLPLLRGTRFAKLDATGSTAALGTSLTRLAPRVVTGDPDSLGRLAELDLPASARPDLVLSTAFGMPPAIRRAIAEATGAEVIEYYATQECAVIGIGCRRGRGYHQLDGLAAVETAPTAAGEPELVITPLGDPWFVLLRYAPGDLGRLTGGLHDRCACGLVGPRIESLQGRASVLFALPGGGAFAPGRLTPLLSRLPARAFRLEQRSPRRYTLALHADAAPHPALLEPIERALRRLVGADVALELAVGPAPPRGPGGKPEPFATRLDARAP